MDLLTLVTQMQDDGSVSLIANNPLAQFGRKRQYLGATLLPEKPVEVNAFTEYSIRYKTIIAPASTRYSPAQMRNGKLLGSFLVVLGESDIKSSLTGRDYEVLTRYLEKSGGAISQEALAQITMWLDTTINKALVETTEKERWEAIVDASLTRTGDNGFSETVAYTDPANHRTAASAAWSTNTTDIFEDIHTKVDLLETEKGYKIARLITSRKVLSIMANNDTVKARAGLLSVTAGVIGSISGRASHQAINGILMDDGLPPIELYDQRYGTETGTMPFLKEDVFVLIGDGDTDVDVDLGDDESLFLPSTLGYTAIGKGVGQSEPGRVLQMVAQTNKPPRIEGEGWQTSLPVILEPEGIAVINTIT